MQAELHELDRLLEIQRIDLETMQAKKKRAELPQRIQVMRLRKKRDEIQAKLDQVLELRKRAIAELTMVEDEDRALAEKQERAQELIDAAGSDYRKVESHSREMAGAAKRRDDLAVKIADAQAQIEKIDAVKSQLEGAIAASEREEVSLRASFEEEDNQLIAFVKANAVARADLASQVPAQLLGLYERTAAKVGGVAMGKLEHDRCGVCRSVIDGGRLIELKASAPLGTCPSCKRLLVIDQD